MDLLGHRNSSIDYLGTSSGSGNTDSANSTTTNNKHDISLFDDLANETKEAAQRASAGGDYKKQVRWNTLRRRRLHVSVIILFLHFIVTVCWILYPPDNSWTINRSIIWLFVVFTLFGIQILACLLANYRYRLLLDLFLGSVYFGIVAFPTLYCVVHEIRLDQRTLFILSLFIYYYPLEIELSYHIWRIVTFGVAICFAISVAWVAPPPPGTWLDRAILTSFTALFTVLTYLPQRFLFILTKTQKNVLETLASESRAQLILLKRVIPDVFIEQLLDGSKRMTSNPIEHVTVLFCEVMVLHRNQTTGEITPKKLGHNIDEKSLAVLSEVFNILDNVVSRNGVYKVETIFSEFVAVSGLPRARTHHPNTAYAMVITAIDMLREVHWALQKGKLATLAKGIEVDLQIGINTGSVVESILGRRLLPRWKLFGDTVNTASRMKSNGICGRIHLSRATRDLLMSSAPVIVRRALEDSNGKLSSSKQKLYDNIVSAYNLMNIRRSPQTGVPGTKSTSSATMDNRSNNEPILTPTGVPSNVSIAGRVGNLPNRISSSTNTFSHTATSAATSSTTLSEQDPECVSDIDVLFGRATGFFCRPRPPMSIKGKGIMCTYVIELCVPDVTKHHMQKVVQRMLGRSPSIAELRTIHDVQEIDDTPVDSLSVRSGGKKSEDDDDEEDADDELENTVDSKSNVPTEAEHSLVHLDTAGNEDTQSKRINTMDNDQPETGVGLDPAVFALLHVIRMRSLHGDAPIPLPMNSLSIDPHVLLPTPTFLLTEPGALSYHAMRWLSKHDKLWTLTPVQMELLRRLSRRIPRRWSGTKTIPTETSVLPFSRTEDTVSVKVSEQNVKTTINTFTQNRDNPVSTARTTDRKRGIGGHRLMDIVSGDIRNPNNEEDDQRSVLTASSMNQLSVTDSLTMDNNRMGSMDDEDLPDDTDIDIQTNSLRHLSLSSTKPRNHKLDPSNDAASMLADKFMSLAFSQTQHKDHHTAGSGGNHTTTNNYQYQPHSYLPPPPNPNFDAQNNSPFSTSGSRLQFNTDSNTTISLDPASRRIMDNKLSHHNLHNSENTFRTEWSTPALSLSSESNLNQSISPGVGSGSQYSFDTIHLSSSSRRLQSKYRITSSEKGLPIVEESDTNNLPPSTVPTTTSNVSLPHNSNETDNSSTAISTSPNKHHHLSPSLDHPISHPVPSSLRGFLSQGHVRNVNETGHIRTVNEPPQLTLAIDHQHTHRHSYPFVQNNHELRAPPSGAASRDEPTSTFDGAIDLGLSYLNPATNVELLMSAVNGGRDTTVSGGGSENQDNEYRQTLSTTGGQEGEDGILPPASDNSSNPLTETKGKRKEDIGDGESVMEPELDPLRIYFVGSQQSLEPSFITDHINQYSLGAWAALLVITFVSVNSYGLAARFEHREFAIFIIAASITASIAIFLALFFHLIPKVSDSNVSSGLGPTVETMTSTSTKSSSILKQYIKRVEEWLTIERRANIYAILVITQVLLVLIGMDLVLLAVSQGEQRIIFDWENTWGTDDTVHSAAKAKGMKSIATNPNFSNNTNPNFSNNTNPNFNTNNTLPPHPSVIHGTVQGPDFAFIIASAAFVLTLMAPYYYGLLYYHHIYLAIASLIILIPPLAVATPNEWQVTIGWLVVIMFFTLRSVRRTELRLRTSFLDRQLVKEQQARTRRMLHAMLPEKIAELMMKKEEKGKDTQTIIPHQIDRKSRDAYEYVCDILGKVVFQYILGFSWILLRPRMWCFRENNSKRANETKILNHHTSSHSSMMDDEKDTNNDHWRSREYMVEPGPSVPVPQVTEISSPPSRRFGSSISRTIRSITDSVRSLPTSLTKSNDDINPNIPDNTIIAVGKEKGTPSTNAGNDGNTMIVHRNTTVVRKPPELSFLRAQTYEVSLLMFDLVGFTSLSADVGPRAVVELLDRMYNSFDRIVSRRGARKIETIGDAFLVACGVPEPVPMITSAMIVAKCAIDMLRAVESFSNSAGPRLRGHRLQARIGIHSGCVLAGVIGDTMPRYQLFGSAVDEVQTMESSSEPGQVHASPEILRYLGTMIPVDDASKRSKHHVLSILPCCSTIGDDKLSDNVSSPSSLASPTKVLSPSRTKALSPSSQIHPETVVSPTGSTTPNTGSGESSNGTVKPSHPRLMNRGTSAYLQRAVPDIKIVRKLEDGSGFIARDRTGGMVRGVAW